MVAQTPIRNKGIHLRSKLSKYQNHTHCKIFLFFFSFLSIIAGIKGWINQVLMMSTVRMNLMIERLIIMGQEQWSRWVEGNDYRLFNSLTSLAKTQIASLLTNKEDIFEAHIMNIKLQVAMYINIKHEFITLASLQLQRGTCDCGLFFITYMCMPPHWPME